jgi:hypothetical protein
MLPLLMVVVDRKILSGVILAFPQQGAVRVEVPFKSQRNMGGLHALLDKSGWRNWRLS